MAMKYSCDFKSLFEAVMFSIWKSLNIGEPFLPKGMRVISLVVVSNAVVGLVGRL